MAETAQKTGAPRRGARATNRTAAAKPAAEKVLSTDAETPPGGIELEKVGETKQYSKWAPPKSSGCVGSLYAPLDTTAVTVMISGPAD